MEVLFSAESRCDNISFLVPPGSPWRQTSLLQPCALLFSSVPCALWHGCTAVISVSLWQHPKKCLGLSLLNPSFGTLYFVLSWFILSFWCCALQGSKDFPSTPLGPVAGSMKYTENKWFLGKINGPLEEQMGDETVCDSLSGSGADFWSPLLR